MKKVRFHLAATTLYGYTDCAYVLDGEKPGEVLVDAVMEGIRTNLEVTISNVTMHLAAWQDPEHWATDWAEELGVPFDDAPDAVAALLAAAEEA
jgi:hypothetical protein